MNQGKSGVKENMSRADEIAQGLREPGGALIGGLVAEDYNQGHIDFENGAPWRLASSASYDIGRWRAQEKADDLADLKAKMEADAAESRRKVRELLAEHPDLLADFDAKMAALGIPTPTPEKVR